MGEELVAARMRLDRLPYSRSRSQADTSAQAQSAAAGTRLSGTMVRYRTRRTTAI
jgi:hypothetical protein